MGDFLGHADDPRRLATAAAGTALGNDFEEPLHVQASPPNPSGDDQPARPAARMNNGLFAADYLTRGSACALAAPRAPRRPRG